MVPSKFFRAALVACKLRAAGLFVPIVVNGSFKFLVRRFNHDLVD